VDVDVDVGFDGLIEWSEAMKGKRSPKGQEKERGHKMVVFKGPILISWCYFDKCPERIGGQWRYVEQ